MNEMLRRFGFTVYAPDDGAGSGDGDDGGSGDGDDGGDGDQGTSSSGSSKTYTQKEFDDAAKGARRTGKSQRDREIAEALGMSVEEAKEFIDKKRADDAANLSEAERKNREAEEKERRANERIAAANRREREAIAVAALAAEGVKFERDDDGNLVGKGARLVKLVTADLDDDASEAAIVSAVGELKADTPELFGSSNSGSGSGDGDGDGDGDNGRGDRAGDGDGVLRRLGKPPSGDLGRPKHSGPATSDDLDRGKARAAKANERNKPFDPFARSAASGTED